MATSKIQLNGVRINESVYDGVKALHDKEGIIHLRTGNKQSFSSYIEGILSKHLFENSQILKARSMDWDDEDFD